MPASSLKQLALEKCMRVHTLIDDFGILPYDMVRPIILKVESPQQLMAIEKNSPHFLGHTGEIWEVMIKRDVPKSIRDSYDTYVPKNPKLWYKVYRKLKQEADEKHRAAAAVFGKAMGELQAEKEKDTMAAVRGVIPTKRPWGASMAPKRNADYGRNLIAKFRGGIRKQQRGQPGPGRAPPPKGVVTKAPIAMLEDYQDERRAGRSSAPKPEPKPLDRLPAWKKAAQNKPVRVVERQRLSEKQLASAPEEPSNANPRKRPAPSAAPTTRPAANIFMQPKRRKLA